MSQANEISAVDKGGRRRQVKATRWVEHQPKGREAPDDGAGPAVRQIREAKVTAVGTGCWTVHLGHFDMSSSPTTGGTWVEDLATDFTAFDDVGGGGASHAVNDYVKVKRRGVGSTGTAYFSILGSGGGGGSGVTGGMFAVLVKSSGDVGGLAGYDLYALTDGAMTTPLNTGGPLAPACSRARTNGALSITAAPDGSMGAAYHDGAGVIALFDCAESWCEAAG